MLPTQLTLVYPLAALLWQKLSVSTWSPWPWHFPGSHLVESHPQAAWQSPWLIWASLPRYLRLQLPQTLHFLVVPVPGESYKCYSMLCQRHERHLTAQTSDACYLSPTFPGTCQSHGVSSHTSLFPTQHREVHVAEMRLVETRFCSLPWH